MRPLAPWGNNAVRVEECGGRVALVSNDWVTNSRIGIAICCGEDRDAAFRVARIVQRALNAHVTLLDKLKELHGTHDGKRLPESCNYCWVIALAEDGDQ